MGLSKETFRPKETEVAFSNANLGSSEIKASEPFDPFDKLRAGKLRTRKAESESRIPELLSLILGEKDTTERIEEPKLKREDGFEPFVNGSENGENNLFVNLYGGAFFQKMELNRKGLERVLKIAHLDGQVFLTTLSPSRQRFMDGVNPPYKTVPTMDGWIIEINDTKILEDLNEKKLTGEKRQEAFVKKFNKLLNKSFFECIRKEKMTSIKDEQFGRKVFISVINPVIGLFIWAPKLLQLDLSAIASFTTAYFAINAFGNLLRLYMTRKFDAPWEYFMPPVEIDKVARALTFLSLKGRTLVKEKKPEAK